VQVMEMGGMKRRDEIVHVAPSSQWDEHVSEVSSQSLGREGQEKVRWPCNRNRGVAASSGEGHLWSSRLPLLSGCYQSTNQNSRFLLVSEYPVSSVSSVSAA
jgi:hypothetical protein